MPETDTHYPQVPLELVKQIIERESRSRLAADQERMSEQKKAPGDPRTNATDDEDLKFPVWQIPVQELILEFDREKFSAKMREVEALILERFQALPERIDGRDEREALDHALSILKTIKHDRLGYRD